MSQDESTAVAELRELVASGQELENDALEALFAEIGEDTIDAIEIGDRKRLVALRRGLRRPYSLLAVREDEEVEETLSFVLGRIAGLLELAGSAVRRQRPAGFERELANQRSFEILELLHEKEMTSSDLTARLGIDKSAVSRRLRKLEAAGLIIRQRSGRRLYSRLTSAAQQALGDVAAARKLPGFRKADDRYRQQLADVLDAAFARLQALQLDRLPALQLEEKHLSAIGRTLSSLAAPEVTEQDVDACENAWRDVGVDTQPSLGEAFEEWLASSEMRLDYVG